MTSRLSQRTKCSVHSPSRWSKCWARHGKRFPPSKKSHIENTAGATRQTGELILRRRQGIMAAGRRRVEARDGNWTRCVRSHLNHIESRKRAFIVTAQWDTAANLRSSVLSVPNTMETCKYPPQMMMWNFKYCRKKKAALVIEACWIWCDSLEWACWLTLACASNRVTS